MPKIVKSLFFAILFSVLMFGKVAQAQTINAASCKQIDVASALASVTADGTTVNIPQGTCIWTTSLSVSLAHSVTIQGQSTTSGTCAPGGSCTANDQTVIQDNINHANGDPPIIGIATSSGKTYRLTGITFQGYSGNSSVSYNGLVRLNGSSQSIRIDHCHFYHLNLIHIIPNGWLYGVIDHNLFDFANSSEMAIKPEASQWNGVAESGAGDASWADGSNFGSNKFIFIENNTFQMQAGSPNHAFAFDCIAGGRFVFRYNLSGYHVATQTHGVSGSSGNGDNGRACRAHEQYQNTFAYSPSPNGSDTNTYFSFLEDNESGSGLFWGNTVTGFQTVQREDVVRTNNSTYLQTAIPNGWGYCGTALGISAWDGNNNSTGYPCIDQVGRGKGDMLTGVFPSKVNSTTRSIAWPHQALDPWYVWNVTFNAVPNASNGGLWSNFDSATVENRDYYLQLPNYKESATFNGTAGVGSGPLSARPATCTAGPGGNSPGVGYWATDVNGGTLFVCNPTNTWSSYYAPYTYPHPLTQGSAPSSGNVSAPSNLTATVQ